MTDGVKNMIIVWEAACGFRFELADKRLYIYRDDAVVDWVYVESPDTSCVFKEAQRIVLECVMQDYTWTTSCTELGDLVEEHTIEFMNGAKVVHRKKDYGLIHDGDEGISVRVYDDVGKCIFRKNPVIQCDFCEIDWVGQYVNGFKPDGKKRAEPLCSWYSELRR